MRVRLAPSWFAAIARSLLLLTAALLIGAVMYSINGEPTLSRKSKFNELVRFARKLGEGTGEVATETIVLIGVTMWFRLGMKVRLEAKPGSAPTPFE